MPSLIAKVTSHVGQISARSRRSICRGTPKFRGMVSLRNFRFFLRTIVVKLRFRPRSPCKVSAAPRLHLVVCGFHCQRPSASVYRQLFSSPHPAGHPPTSIYGSCTIGLSQGVGYPRAAVLVQRSVTHVRYHGGAEQEYQECQHNQIPPIP